MNLHVLKLTLLFYLCELVQNAAAQECRAKKSIDFNKNHLNVLLNGFVIQNITVPAVADCARECFRLTKCLSFNMATSIGLCQLNSVNSSTNLILVADNKFNYFDLSVFPETIAGPCGNKPCLMHQICLPTNDKHTCANVECLPYIAPKNGKIKPTTAVIADRNVTVSCRAGFSIVGDSLLTCQFDGLWTGVAPKRYCPPAVAPSDGEVSAPNSYDGETATYTCLIGYSLIGSGTATCAKGAWSPSAPLCKQVDCYDVKQSDAASNSGTYTVYLNNTTHDVYCDMVTVGGGWTVFQRRFNGSVDFYQTFKEYENGFGDLRGEFWLGLRYIQDMTSQGNSELRLDLEGADGSAAYKTYQNFYLSGVSYTFYIGQSSAGTEGDTDRLWFNVGQAFSTYDQDNANNCAVQDHGGWWYNSCTYANLNGDYATPGTVSHYNDGEGGVIYLDFKQLQSLESTKMMFRRN